MYGEVLSKVGVVYEDEKTIVVKKSLVAGEAIQRHSHPGQRIFFTCVKGALSVTLASSEVHEVSPGVSLTFIGDHSIEAVAKEDSEVFVTLVK